MAGGIIWYAPLRPDGIGVADRTVDNSVPPGAVNILSGAIWNFHFWYRAPAAGGAGFNTTDVVEVEFCD